METHKLSQYLSLAILYQFSLRPPSRNPIIWFGYTGTEINTNDAGLRGCGVTKVSGLSLPGICALTSEILPSLPTQSPPPTRTNQRHPKSHLDPYSRRNPKTHLARELEPLNMNNSRQVVKNAYQTHAAHAFGVWNQVLQTSGGWRIVSRNLDFTTKPILFVLPGPVARIRLFAHDTRSEAEEIPRFQTISASRRRPPLCDRGVWVSFVSTSLFSVSSPASCLYLDVCFLSPTQLDKVSGKTEVSIFPLPRESRRVEMSSENPKIVTKAEEMWLLRGQHLEDSPHKAQSPHACFP